MLQAEMASYGVKFLGNSFRFHCQNLQEAQMEKMKQLRNFIETNRQQDCVYFT
jgi:hypothetical protein